EGRFERGRGTADRGAMVDAFRAIADGLESAPAVRQCLPVDSPVAGRLGLDPGVGLEPGVDVELWTEGDDYDACATFLEALAVAHGFASPGDFVTESKGDSAAGHYGLKRERGRATASPTPSSRTAAHLDPAENSPGAQHGPGNSAEPPGPSENLQESDGAPENAARPPEPPDGAQEPQEAGEPARETERPWPRPKRGSGAGSSFQGDLE